MRLIPAVIAAVHFVISWIVIVAVATGSRDAQWQLVWLYFWIADFPVSLIHVAALAALPHIDVAFLPSKIGDFNNFLVPALVYGVLSPAWYYLIAVLIGRAYRWLSGKRVASNSGANSP